MKTFQIVSILFTLFTYSLGIDNFMKFSPEDSMKLFKSVDCLKGYSQNCDLEDSKMYFESTTGLDANGQNIQYINEQLMLLANQFIAHSSWFDKFTGLLTFYNILGFLMAITGVVFAIALAGDILAVISLQLLAIIFTKRNIYLMGFILSYLNCFYDYLFIFGDFSPFFGSLLFTLTFGMFYDDVLKSNNSENKSDGTMTYIASIIWCGITTVYHKDQMVGVLTTFALYSLAGYGMKSVRRGNQSGYQFGFKSYDSLVRCMFLSLFLIPFFASHKIGYYESSDLWLDTLQYFQTGVFFWGTMISCLCILILADPDVMCSKNIYTVDKFITTQMILILWYGGLLYFGSLYNIQYFTNICGTFGVLWLMDMERIVISNLGSGKLSIYLGIILLNLYGLRYYIQTYPDYFIF